VAAKRDITQEVNLEEQYRQMQKMETIGRLIVSVKLTPSSQADFSMARCTQN